MSLISSLFSWRGRMARGDFWIKLIFYWLIFLALNALTSHLSSAIGFALSALMLAVLLSHCVRRLHDRGYSARWLLIALIPVLGATWLFWQLACRRGVESENTWGNDPANPIKEFLVVR